MGVITIGVPDFVKGMSTAKNIPDKGFSPESKGVRLIVGSYNATSKTSQNLNDGTGLIRPQGTVVNLSNVVDYPIINIVNSYLSSASSSPRAIMVAPKGTIDAEFYLWGKSLTGEPTHPTTDSSGVNRYDRLSQTQMAIYGDKVYVSNNIDIVKMDLDLTNLNTTWWSTGMATALASGDPHPLLVTDKKLYVGDGTKLRYYDGTNFVEKLDLGEDRITALYVNPATGFMFIATTSNTNRDGYIKRINKIKIWDGQSTLVSKDIFVEDMVTSFYNLGGLIYCFYGTSMGVWNGQGITFIRALNIGLDEAELIYPGRVTDINGTLYILEAQKNDIKALAYGSIFSGGRKVFYYPFSDTAPESASCLVSMGGLFVATKQFRPHIALPYVDESVNNFQVFNPYDDGYNPTNKQWLSNVYNLPTNALVTRVDVWCETLVTGDQISIQLISDQNTSETLSGNISFGLDGAIEKKSFSAIDTKTSSFQVGITWSDGFTGIRQIRVFYDLVEEEL